MTNQSPNLDATRIKDYISGQLIPAGPEETAAVQPFSKMLVEDYGYPKAHIRTRPQWHVKVSPSDVRKTAPVDIAVFNSAVHDSENLEVIVECKKPGSVFEDGYDNQLFNYLSLSAATVGVWTNGETRLVFHKTVRDGRFHYDKLPNLPRFGEKVSEIGLYRRKDLIVPKNLQQVFRSIRAHLVGNAKGTTRDEVIASQMINLIFCKIYDETYTPQETMVTFRAAVDDTPTQVLDRVKDLFEKVKNSYTDVFSAEDTLKLDADSVKYVVGELQNFCLTEAERDAVGQAFEVFIGSSLKGEQGQFFTPRNVIKLMVEIAAPQRNDRVIDPACGAGGFLVESLRHKHREIEDLGRKMSWPESKVTTEKSKAASETIYGIDKDDFLGKVAKAYLSILSESTGHVYSEDSLDVPVNWDEAFPNIQLGGFNLVLANPPFGKDIKVTGEEKLRQYSLARKWNNKKSESGRTTSSATDKLEKERNPQVLFVERCLQLAQHGGTVGIILPETYFHAPSTAFVREVLLRKNNVKALIDLPHNTFRPFNNAKCIAVIVEKGVPQQDEIQMIVAEEMGHDHNGRELFRPGTDELWDDIAAATMSIRNGEESKFVFTTPSADVLTQDIWVPRYYWDAYNEDVINEEDESVTWISIGELISRNVLTIHDGHGSPTSKEKGEGEFTYARVKDIVNWEIYRDPTSGVTEEVMRKFTSKYPLQAEDIAYVARGSYRIGSVAMVGAEDLDTVLTREIHVFRVNKDNDLGITPFYLLYLLTTEAIQRQTKARVFLDTTLPTIAKRYTSIKLPIDNNVEKRHQISSKIEGIVRKRWEAIAEMRELLLEHKL